ncbi:unnamed protein product [Discula destructiva]
MLFSQSTLIFLTQAVTVLASPAYQCGGAPCAAGDFVLAVRNSDPFVSFASAEEWKRYERYGSSNVKRYIDADPPMPKGDAQHVGRGHFRSVGGPPLPRQSTSRARQSRIRDGHFQSLHGSSEEPPSPPTHLDAQHLRGGDFRSVGSSASRDEAAAASDRGVYTTDLRTNIGVAVVGTSRATGAQTRHLAHLHAGRDVGATWTGFLREIRARELSDVTVVVRMPDLSVDLPRRAYGAPWDWSEDDAALAAMVRSEVQILVRSNLGVVPRVVASPMGAVYRGERDAGTMEISGSVQETRVYVDGQVVV